MCPVLVPEEFWIQTRVSCENIFPPPDPAIRLFVITSHLNHYKIFKIQASLYGNYIPVVTTTLKQPFRLFFRDLR